MLHLKLSLLQPLSGLQSNGPGLHYRVMWRQKGVDSDWTTVTVANNSEFVVSGTPTFVPYEIKVQSVNDHGAGPEPAIAHGYSGEDCELHCLFRALGDEFDCVTYYTQNDSVCFLFAFSGCPVVFLVCCTVPVAAPQNVQAVVRNSTLAEVHWDPVPHKFIRGHLKGYKVWFNSSKAA